MSHNKNESSAIFFFLPWVASRWPASSGCTFVPASLATGQKFGTNNAFLIFVRFWIITASKISAIYARTFYIYFSCRFFVVVGPRPLFFLYGKVALSKSSLFTNNPTSATLNRAIRENILLIFLQLYMLQIFVFFSFVLLSIKNVTVLVAFEYHRWYNFRYPKNPACLFSLFQRLPVLAIL